VWFKPPSSSFKGDFSNYNFIFFPKVYHPTIIVGHGGDVWSFQRALLIFKGGWHLELDDFI
jgi:hypothetical protein